MTSQLTPAMRAAAAERIATEMARRGMTQVQLAALSGYDERTLRTLLKGGVVKDATLAALCTALDIDYDELLKVPNSDKPSGVAPATHGSYSRASVERYAGQYLTVRPAFSADGRIWCYCTEMAWDDAQSCMTFVEKGRPDAQYSHTGQLYVPSDSSYVYLMSLGGGSARMVVVSHLRASQGTMRGVITSLTEVAGAMYIPVTAPIVYIKRKEVAASECGGLRSTDPAYEKLRRLLTETISESHIRMVGPP